MRHVLIGIMAIVLLGLSVPAWAKNNDAVAVVIGNKNYRGDRIPDVEFAHNDAAAFKRFLIDVLGYREGNIIDLRDTTQAQMTAAFGNRETHEGTLWQYLRPGRSDVTVFYSGHGVPGLKDRRGYLLPVDADPNRPEINGFPVDVLYDNLSKLEARTVTVYLDACFSGESDQGMLIRGTSGIAVKPRLPEHSGKLVVLTAAQGDQVASWDAEARHGLFTHHLLDALHGRADQKPFGDGDGTVSAGEAKAYLDEEMTYAARRRHGRIQNANLQGAKDAVLGVLPGSKPLERRPVAAPAPEKPLMVPPSRVRLAQKLLSELDFDPGPVDGRMGAKTRRAIEAFELSQEVTVVGAVTDNLVARLKAARKKLAALPPPARPARPADLELSVPALVDRIKSAVVGLSGPQEDGGGRRALGSGFVVDPGGYIVTNNHILRDATTIMAQFEDGSSRWARIVGRDPRTDIAVLRVQVSQDLPFVVWGDSHAAKLGDRVVAVAKPYGVAVEIASGTITPRERDILAGLPDDFIQVDTSIDHRHSGAPMINDRGEVIGIATDVEMPENVSKNIGFAVSSNVAVPVVEQLRGTGSVRRGWLGVHIQEVTDEIAGTLDLGKARGALVTSVVANAPAAAAGLKTGDVILKFDGQDIVRMKALSKIVANTPPGTRVPVQVWRQEGTRDIQVVLGLLPEAEPSEPASGSIDALQVTVATITPELRKEHDIGDDVTGLVVTGVTEKGPAHAKGIAVGEVLIEISRSELIWPSDALRLIANAREKGKRSVLVLVGGKAGPRFIAIPIGG